MISGTFVEEKDFLYTVSKECVWKLIVLTEIINGHNASLWPAANPKMHLAVKCQTYPLFVAQRIKATI